VVIALLLGRKPLFNWQHGSWRKKIGTSNASKFLLSPMLADKNTDWGDVYHLGSKEHKLVDTHGIQWLKAEAATAKTIRTYQGGFSFKFFDKPQFMNDLETIGSGGGEGRAGEARSEGGREAARVRVARYLQRHDSTAMQCLMPEVLRLSTHVTAAIDR
jgi:hypothetical protein